MELPLFIAEEWKDVPNYEGIYSVSNWGRIRRDKSRTRGKAGTILTPSKNLGGYLMVQLYKNGVSCVFTVHKLVLAAFVGPRPDGHDINHKDGIKTGNHLLNLEYATKSQNMLHSYRVLGKNSGSAHYLKRNPELHPRGENHPKAKLTEQSVIEIRHLRKSGRSLKELAQQFGVSIHSISEIARGLSWVHV